MQVHWHLYLNLMQITGFLHSFTFYALSDVHFVCHRFYKCNCSNTEDFVFCIYAEERKHVRVYTE